MNVEDKDKGWNQLVKDLKSLVSMEVVVGLFDGSGIDDAEKNVAYRGYVNEYGQENIPPRPFMRGAWDNNINVINNMKAKLVGKVIDGEITAETYFKILGEFLKNKIKDSITNGNWTPNSPVTIEMKKSSKPLIWTGEMRNRIDYKIRQRTKDNE